MKKGFFAGLVFMLLASVALAFGPAAQTTDKMKLPTAVPTKTTCVSVAKGRATQATVDMKGKMFFNWKADDGAGTGVAMKRSFDTEAGYMASTGENNVPVAPARKLVVFTRYTGATSINLCHEE